jgi:pseudouridine-5'-phosphate glycosidase
MSMGALPIDLSAEVSGALQRRQAVVALESTIITHGMPHPANPTTAREVESIVRETGAVPATIVVLAGRIKIGLSDEDLGHLAVADNMMKLSRADLPFALSQRRSGSTTVAATMICAALAGLPVFATGGIGGVHRGVETSLDISADLEELASTDVAVVCAGAKALLDLPRTLEYLETRGVPVVGYGVDEFPAFWSRSSGLAAPLRLDTPAAVAGLIRSKRALALGGGVLVCNPVPKEHEFPASEIEAHIRQAVAEAADQGVTGKAVTPFILGRLLELTSGRSLATNIALIKNNAALAARVALELASAVAL